MWIVAVGVASVKADDAPPAEAFHVLPQVSPDGPNITPLLKYQTEIAWRQDEQRRKRWETIRTETDLLGVQRELRERLLKMLGGLPTEKTPLHSRITGRIQMEGFHIEKLIFESLPGVFVTALVYVPDDKIKLHPGILVPSGHSANGKVHYQALCQRLVLHGYVVISWDPVGQGERSQFWDAKKHKSRYNLICAEHAVMGNLAYLAGTNLARWEVWDGIRAVDYLLSRNDVDADRINITGTSGGGFQTATIAALDSRIKVAAPSCYITALAMRVYNRIFKDPDSDPEQDLYGMISDGVGHPGLLLMMYPRPVFVAAATLDFFPIEGTHKTFREAAELYAKFGYANRIEMHEGYHGHEYSLENQERAIEFLDHFNGVPLRRGLPSVKELDDKTLQCTQSGQVMLDYENARSLMDLIRDYYSEHQSGSSPKLAELYYSDSHPAIDAWRILPYDGTSPSADEIRWEHLGTSKFEGIDVERYLLHHSQYLELPLLYIHNAAEAQRKFLLWLSESGKPSTEDWPEIKKFVAAGYGIIGVDPRGLGETRMRYKAVSEDDPTLAQLDYDHAYVNPLSGVLAGYVYNSLLTGRPYFMQMIEDVEIATRFARVKINGQAEFVATGTGEASTFASAVAEVLPKIELIPQSEKFVVRWSELVKEKREVWPIQYLLPGGAYIH